MSARWRRHFSQGGRQFLLLALSLLLVACVSSSLPSHPQSSLQQPSSLQENNRKNSPLDISAAALFPGSVSLGQEIADAQRTDAEGNFWDAESAQFPTEHAGKPQNPLLAASPPQTIFEGLGSGPLKRSNFFVAQRAYPLDVMPVGGFAAALEQTMAMLPLEAAETLPAWQNIGPAPMVNSRAGQQKVNVSGRVTALAIDPTQPNTVYLGAAQGGVWKTTNGGDSWTPLTDNQASMSMGALALDPQNPSTIYAGTGEPTQGLDNYYGAGILKSTDGGATWTRQGVSAFNGLAIARILVHPANSNTLFAASSQSGQSGPVSPARGIFRSKDGGLTWEGLLTCTDCFGATDLEMDSGDPNTLYAGFQGFGVFKSTDGGNNWGQLTNNLPNPKTVGVGRVVLSISKSNPAVVYASYQVIVPNQYDGAGIFVTTNGGATWTQISTGGYNFCGSQCWYSHTIEVDPTNPNTLYAGGTAAYSGNSEADFTVRQVVIKTTNGGGSWLDLSDNSAPNKTLHPDMHVIAFDPANSQTVWAGNDGGVWKSTNGGQTWLNRNTNLATLQFTGIAVDPTNPSVIQGGMQDNNKAFTTDGGSTPGWTAADVGDGGFAAIDPFNTTIWYGTRFGKSFQRNEQGSGLTGFWPIIANGIDQADRALFYVPLAVDPSTQGVLYLGTFRVYRTANRGDSWTAISPDLSAGQGYVSAIAVAPSNAATVWAGTSDGKVQVTINGGSNWTDITKAPLPNRYVSRIAVSPTDPQTAYVVFSGFNSHTPGQSGHVFKTTDRGASWQDISSNLPDVPVQSIVLDGSHPGTVYIGTDTGVFRTVDDGSSWIPFNNGMANVAVVDLVLTGNKLFAATHGRSVFRVDLAGQPAPMNKIVFLPIGLRNLSPGTIPATSTPTPSATPTRTPIGGTGLPTSTPTETPPPTPIPSNTPTSTATFTPGTPGTPTRTPSATPTFPRTPTPDPRVYADDFERTDSGWPTTTLGNCSFGYTVAGGNGVYAMWAGVNGQICIMGAPAAAQTDGLYEVTAFKNSPGDGSIYGLSFGMDSADPNAVTQFYVLWVDPLSQSYALQKYDNGAWSFLNALGSWQGHSAILAGDQANHLRVRREGSQILLFANGQILEEVTDNSLAGNGFVGLANAAAYSSPALAGFDDIRINQIRTVYLETFDQESSGWFTGQEGTCQASYSGGEYQTATGPGYLCLFRAPLNGERNGRFEVDVRREESFYQMAYGLFFAESGDFTSFYAFLVLPDTQGYALLRYVESVGWQSITWDAATQSGWLTSDKINTTTATNHLLAEVDGNLLRVSVNGVLLGAFTDASPLGGNRFGVINWASQLDTAVADFDNGSATAWDTGGAALGSASMSLGAGAINLPLEDLAPQAAD